MRLESGKTYADRWGDVHGPMDERAPGVFLDQHGAVYQPDGRQWNHLSESMSTIICEFSHQFDAREQHDGWANGVQGPSETLNPLHVGPSLPSTHHEAPNARD